MKIAQLLLVDANRDNLDILTFILSEKYRVSGHGSVSEALTALEAARPDLLLLDIGMSPVDGLQCLEAVRGMPGYGSIPAIALTAYASDVDREAFLAAGFQAVVTKPILDHRELFAAITPLLTSVAQTPSHDPPGADPGYGQSSARHRALTAPTGLTAPTTGGMIPGSGFDKPSTPRSS